MAEYLEQMFNEIQQQGVNTQKVPTFAAGSSATAGGVAGVYLGSSSIVGVFFGSGAPSVSAAKGSLYLRTDGSGTTNRIYVNTDGSTTWTNITTAT